MDVIHEWDLERYGKLDSRAQSGWTTFESEGHSLKILSSRTLLISSPATVLESFRLFNSVLWLKCFQKGDSLLLLHKIEDCTRKFRLKFKAKYGRSSMETCNEVVKVLRQYISVVDVNSQALSQDTQATTRGQTSECLTGEVTQGQHAQALLGLNKLTLPNAYASCSYPTDELETLVRLCIIDPSFPAFISEVERVINTVTAAK